MMDRPTAALGFLIKFKERSGSSASGRRSCIVFCIIPRQLNDITSDTAVRSNIFRYTAYMEGIIIALLTVLIILVTPVFLRSLKKREDAESDGKGVNTRLEEMRKTLDTRLHQNTESMQKQLQEQIRSFTRELTEIKSTGREMLSFTEQLQSLEQTLKNPQRRGAVGEYILERVIANVLPPDSYATQYTFKNGVRADAVIFLQDDKIISMDAKFSLDNYTKLLCGESNNPDSIERRLREDLKARIKETAKYIIPEEGTLDYAFMFIPSEALYYDLLTQKIGGDGQNMLEFAFNAHKVIIVSPTTLLAYLQTVSLGLRSFRVEKHAQEIITQVQSLKKHLETYTKAFHGVGKSLGTAVNHYNRAEQQYALIDKDVYKITGEGGAYVKEPIDRPHTEEGG